METCRFGQTDVVNPIRMAVLAVYWLTATTITAIYWVSDINYCFACFNKHGILLSSSMSPR